MADNTTTYTAVIETKVTGADEVGDLGNKAGETDGKFKSLKSQIRETTVSLQKLSDEGKEGTAEFEKLRSKLDELNDAQDRVNFQAGQFDDQLASLPGPLGQVGGAVKGFNEGLNRLSTGFKVALGVVGLLVSAFLAIKESLSRTEEGQAKLNKITEAFSKIMNGLFAIIEPIAMLFADLVIGLLASDKAMNALSTAAGVLSATFQTLFNVGKSLVGFIINNFVNAFKVLTEVAGGAGKVLKGVFTFDLDLIKEGISQVGDGIKKGFKATVDNVKNTVKGIGTGLVDGITNGMEQGSKAFTAGSKRLTEAEKKAAEEAKKNRDEAAKKRGEDEKKAAEQRAKDLAAASKVETEAYLATLDARDKEIFKRGQKLNEDIAALEKAGIKDLTAVKEAYRLEVLAINTKYDEEEAKKAEEKKTKEREAAKLAFEEAVMNNENQSQIVENRYNQEIAIVNDREKLLLSAVGLSEEQKKAIQEQAATDRLALQGARYDELIAVIDAKEKLALSNTELNEAQKTKIQLDAIAERKAIEQLASEDAILGIDTELERLKKNRKSDLLFAQKIFSYFRGTSFAVKSRN
jgi:hypothetical protein